MNLKHVCVALLVSVAASAHADPITWNQWTSNSTGTMGPVAVTFAGETSSGWYAAYPSWTPATTWADGVVIDNNPTGGIIRLLGGSTQVNTLTFSKPVVDPVVAIWSLGQGSIAPSFDFIGAAPIFVVGGPSAEYVGSSIYVVGNSVFGAEGNGSVLFKGTYTSLSWTNPKAEDWYGFNVGITAAVPEPETYALTALGLLALGAVARRARS